MNNELELGLSHQTLKILPGLIKVVAKAELKEMKKAEKADKAAEIAYLEKKKELEVKKFFFKNFFSFKS